MCISSPETNSWSVIYRKNSGEDINITSLTFKNSLLAARTLMVPENYMNTQKRGEGQTMGQRNTCRLKQMVQVFSR